MRNYDGWDMDLKKKTRDIQKRDSINSIKSIFIELDN